MVWPTVGSRTAKNSTERPSQSVGSGDLAVGGATAAAGDALTTPSDVTQGLRQTPVEYGEQEQ